MKENIMYYPEIVSSQSMENVDRCACCGEIIPEGQMVCPNCMVCVKEDEDD